MAVTTMASTVGTTIGPPADMEYAVDPVGVLTMIPSAEYCATSSPSTETLSRTTRATPPLWTTTSFSTSGSTRPALSPFPVIVDCSASRGSVVKAWRTMESSTQSSVSGAAVVRNPTRPRLSPRIGVSEPLRLRARRVLVRAVRYAQRNDTNIGCGRLHECRQRRAEAVHDGAVFDRHEQLVSRGEPLEDLAVHRLEKPSVHDRDVETVRREQLGCLHRRLAHHADRQDRAILSFSQKLPRAIRHRRHFGGRWRLGRCLVTGIPQREGTIGVRQRAAQQPD